MSQAIIVPYVVDQNEPSKPLSELHDISISDHSQKHQLISLWKEIFADPAADPADFGLSSWDDLVVENGESCRYGDLSIGDSSNHLFVTWVK